jgi:hypothetical protein
MALLLLAGGGMRVVTGIMRTRWPAHEVEVEVGVVMEAGEKVVVMEEMAGAAVRPVATGIA